QKAYDKIPWIISSIDYLQMRAFSRVQAIRNRLTITNSFRFPVRAQVRKDCKINVPHPASSFFYEEGELAQRRRIIPFRRFGQKTPPWPWGRPRAVVACGAVRKVRGTLRQPGG